MTNSKELLILVDGSSYLYRAFHALPPLVSSKGQPTGAIRGVVSMIKKLLLQYPTNNIGVIFDAKGKTFRHDMYPEYKANRPPMPDDLRAQIEPLHELIQAHGWPLIAVPNVEADDVIGTYAKIASQAGQKVLVSTGDKDMAQLVNDDVHLINTMNNYYFDHDGVVEKFGVTPDQIIDYLALMGDTSDNIPGIPKVGPKTAVKWLAKYKSLDNIVANADEFGGKIGEYLRASLEQLPLSKKLTTIDCDLHLETPVEALRLETPNTAHLHTMYQDLEFKSWLRELDKAPVETTPQATEEPTQKETAADYQTVLSQADFDALLTLLNNANITAFDTETTSLDELDAEIVGLSFAVKAEQAYYIPVAHDYLDAPQQLDRMHVLNSLKPWLENTDKHKVGQNLKYDYKVLLNYDIELKGISDDTMLASYVSNPTAGRHDMDTLASRCLDRTTIHYEDLTGKGKSQINFSQVAIEDATPYAAEDADITLQLHQHFQPELNDVKTLNSVYKDIEVPLLSVLAKIETNGVQIDTSLLSIQSQEITARVAEIEKEAFDIAGEPFNLNSPKQLQKIFFEDLKIPVIRKTSKGQPSTAVDVLEELAQDYPLPKLILEHRSMVKLKNTYIDKLPQQINAKTGRVHTSYHQAVASTGRLSSVNPNLQNIPIKSAEGRRIRQAFTAPNDHKIVAIDYSQIELRIMAHLSNDKGLITAFNDGLDIHTATAAEVFDIDKETVEAEQRRAAKAINFGLIYGMSAFGLAKQLNVGRRDAQTYIDLYFSRYPGVLDYMETTKANAKESGYVETLLGRRLYLPDINARNGQTRAYAERTAINAPMQGTAADIIKLAMLAVDKHLMKHPEQGKMIMQVHDELVFEIPEKGLDNTSALIKKEMESVIELTVPLIAEVGIGDNWDEAH